MFRSIPSQHKRMDRFIGLCKFRIEHKKSAKYGSSTASTVYWRKLALEDFKIFYDILSSFVLVCDLLGHYFILVIFVDATLRFRTYSRSRLYIAPFLALSLISMRIRILHTFKYKSIELANSLKGSFDPSIVRILRGQLLGHRKGTMDNGSSQNTQPTQQPPLNSGPTDASNDDLPSHSIPLGHGTLSVPPSTLKYGDMIEYQGQGYSIRSSTTPRRAAKDLYYGNLRDLPDLPTFTALKLTQIFYTVV